MLRAAAGVLPGVDCAAAAETDKQNPAAVSSNTMTRTPRAVAHLLLTGLMRCAPIVYQRAADTRRTDCHRSIRYHRRAMPRGPFLTDLANDVFISYTHIDKVEF